MTVYVVQQHQRRHPQTGEWEMVHNLDPARSFGEVVTLLGPRTLPFWDTEEIIGQLRERLSCYNPEHDWIIPMGNPALIGWAVAIAAAAGNGRVRTLVWSSRERRYMPTDALLFPDCVS